MSIRPPAGRPGAVRGAGRVKPPRSGSDRAGAGEGIAKLGLAINQIQQHNASQLSFEETYRHAYTMVLHKKGHELYNTVASLIGAHLAKEAQTKVVPAFPPAQSGGLVDAQHSSSSNMSQAAACQLFLDSIRAVWDDHLACMSKIKDVLKYMDKVYTGSLQLPHTWDLGLSLFFHHVILHSTKPKPAPVAAATAAKPSTPSRQSQSASGSASGSTSKLPTADPSTVAHQLIQALLSIIRIEREGEVVSRHSIRSSIEILCELTDEGPVPLPIQASAGVGSGTPVLGVGSGGSNARARAVMGIAADGEQESPYKTAFEKAFLAQSEHFYAKESAQLLIDCDCPSFLIRIERRLDEEATRAQSYLHASTEPLLINLLEKTLITTHLDSILDHPASGLTTLLHDSRVDDLARMYTLFGRVPTGHDHLQRGLSAWIVSVGKQVNEGLNLAGEEADASDPKGKGREAEGAGADGRPKKAAEGAVTAKTKAALGWVQNVLDLKDKFDLLLSRAFKSDKQFEKTINDAFSSFVNANAKSPEFISLFVDENLKKGLKGKTEDEVELVLEKAISLFRFLSEKDLFEKYYNSHLAKRLISQKSVSDDAEHNMLQKFKVEAGAAFTKSAEGMLKDVKISDEMLQAYKRHQDRPNAVRAPLEMVTIVCGQNFWPFGSSKDQACNLPQVLLQGIAAFESFYSTKHSGRKLTFRPELGNVELKAKFKARSHELTVSTHGMVVLAMFDTLSDGESIAYQDILRETGMAPAELKRTLQSLACAKYKILTKQPKGKDVDDSDQFSFNSAFACPMQKIKILPIAAKVESSEERRETEDKVDEMRNTQCEACIVRVMKDRKTLLHADLINEVIRQLSSRFQPKPVMIKQAVERLIDKEYLERDPDDRRRIAYVA